MKRKIIVIDEGKCNGCRLCVEACHEGALAIVEGKAKLISDSYCDGLGDCLPECPTGAIQIVEREAEKYNETLVKRRMAIAKSEKDISTVSSQGGGCYSASANYIPNVQTTKDVPGFPNNNGELQSWPLQIKLVNPDAPFLQGSRLLVAADCTAFAYGGIQELIRERVVLIGCPKLDQGDYSEKLEQIISRNDIQDITVLRMEVPCCAGIVNAVKTALQNSGKAIPWSFHTVSTGGEIM